jgi:protein phosphatase
MSSTTNRNAPDGEVIIHVAGRTDVGQTREHNEDAFAVADLTTGNPILQPDAATHALGPKGSLFMVADGMGGAAAGEIASAMAVEVILGEMRTSWIAQEATSAEAFVRAIKQATKAANQQINAFATQHPEYRGMGTTATIAGLLGDTLYLAQVGDSRAYIVRDGVTRQITKDQSLMQKLIEAGEMTEEEAEHSERRNIILQALGPEPVIKVDLTHQRIRRGDTLVLCSDGLSGQVTKEQIADAVRADSDLTKVCARLVDLANANGGPDNITVIAARFGGSGLRTVGEADEVGHQVFRLPETGTSPAIPVDRIESDTPTEPIPVVTRPTPPRTQRVTPAQAPRPPIGERPIVIDESPAVSRARRSTGTLIAVMLLALLILGAAWFLARSTRAVTEETSASAPRG